MRPVRTVLGGGAVGLLRGSCPVARRWRHWHHLVALEYHFRRPPRGFAGDGAPLWHLFSKLSSGGNPTLTPHWLSEISHSSHRFAGPLPYKKWKLNLMIRMRPSPERLSIINWHARHAKNVAGTTARAYNSQPPSPSFTPVASARIMVSSFIT